MPSLAIYGRSPLRGAPLGQRRSVVQLETVISVPIGRGDGGPDETMDVIAIAQPPTACGQQSAAPRWHPLRDRFSAAVEIFISGRHPRCAQAQCTQTLFLPLPRPPPLRPCSWRLVDFAFRPRD